MIHLFKKFNFRWLFQAAGLALIALSVLSSCKKDSELKTDEDKDTTDSAFNFIPRKGINYHYTLITPEGDQIPFYKRIDGQRDSAGIKVSDVTTYMTHLDQQVTLKQQMFSKEALTFTVIYKAEEWERYVNLLRQSLSQSGGVLLEMKTSGFPFYSIMENDARVGSTLNFTGAPEQTLYIKARIGTGDNASIIEVNQTIKRSDGLATKREKITVPAGTFECLKYEMSVDNHQQTKLNGQVVGVLDTHDFNQVWVTPKIGDVKIISQNSKTGISTTVLSKIGN